MIPIPDGSENYCSQRQNARSKVGQASYWIPCICPTVKVCNLMCCFEWMIRLRNNTKWGSQVFVWGLCFHAIIPTSLSVCSHHILNNEACCTTTLSDCDVVITLVIEERCLQERNKTINTDRHGHALHPMKHCIESDRYHNVRRQHIDLSSNEHQSFRSKIEQSALSCVARKTCSDRTLDQKPVRITAVLRSFDLWSWRWQYRWMLRRRKRDWWPQLMQCQKRN